MCYASYLKAYTPHEVPKQGGSYNIAPLFLGVLIIYSSNLRLLFPKSINQSDGGSGEIFQSLETDSCNARFNLFQNRRIGR